MDLTNTRPVSEEDLKDSFELLPAGDYIAAITEDEQKTSKSGNEYLSLTWTILDGALQGRKIFQNLNLFHSSADVRGFAEKDLNKIKYATGILSPRDSSEFRGIACNIRVKIKDDFNQITKISKIDDNQTQPTMTTGATTISTSPVQPAIPAQNKPAFLK